MQHVWTLPETISSSLHIQIQIDFWLFHVQNYLTVAHGFLTSTISHAHSLGNWVLFPSHLPQRCAVWKLCLGTLSFLSRFQYCWGCIFNLSSSFSPLWNGNPTQVTWLSNILLLFKYWHLHHCFMIPNVINIIVIPKSLHFPDHRDAACCLLCLPPSLGKSAS